MGCKASKTPEQERVPASRGGALLTAAEVPNPVDVPDPIDAESDSSGLTDGEDEDEDEEEKKDTSRPDIARIDLETLHHEPSWGDEDAVGNGTGRYDMKARPATPNSEHRISGINTDGRQSWRGGSVSRNSARSTRSVRSARKLVISARGSARGLPPPVPPPHHAQA
eukprot:TRINITY_DN24946_c0_g1_i1.p1 TRINITY_DN24946_c0_g1~~TRINITY_DN24946_c0_g1_i1.p1  ORF type:complete len:167 (+),score=30.31 TRINITY_DN24946_c0_g1_i1:54-554(+)